MTNHKKKFAINALTRLEELRKKRNALSVNSVDNPAPTIPAQRQPILVQAIHSNYSNNKGLKTIDEPCDTVTVKDRHSLVSAEWIDKQYGGNQHNHESTDGPAGSITGVPKMNLVQAEQFIMDTQFGNGCQSPDQPLGTITANRKWHYLMNPQYMNAGCSIDRPAFTLIARMDKMAPYLVYTEAGQVAIEVYETDSPMTVKIKQFMALYGLYDIKMRMLKVSELKKIQGFPEDYELSGNQSDQKKFIGNSVVPEVIRHWTLALHDKIKELKIKVA